MPSESSLEQICEDDLTSGKDLSNGDSPTLFLGLSILEAGRVICLVWALSEDDTEIGMRV